MVVIGHSSSSTRRRRRRPPARRSCGRPRRCSSAWVTMSCISCWRTITGGSTMSSSASKTACRFAGGDCSRYGASLSWSAIGGSSQLDVSRVSTVVSDDVRNSSHLRLVGVLGVRADDDAVDEHRVGRGGVARLDDDVPLERDSASGPNCQMPLCHIASLPSREQRGVEVRRAAAVGHRRHRRCRACRPATRRGDALGRVERRRAAVRRKNCAAGLGQRLVELVERHRLVVAPHAGGGVGQRLGGGPLVLPRPVRRRVRDAGLVEQRLVVDQHDVGERLRQPYWAPSCWNASSATACRRSTRRRRAPRARRCRRRSRSSRS